MQKSKTNQKRHADAALSLTEVRLNFNFYTVRQSLDVWSIVFPEIDLLLFFWGVAWSFQLSWFLYVVFLKLFFFFCFAFIYFGVKHNMIIASRGVEFPLIMLWVCVCVWKESYSGFLIFTPSKCFFLIFSRPRINGFSVDILFIFIALKSFTFSPFHPVSLQRLRPGGKNYASHWAPLHTALGTIHAFGLDCICCMLHTEGGHGCQ